jgi:hypothetical protein
MNMKSTYFALDCLPDDSFEGFDTGEIWNGWAVPVFTFDQAQAVVAAWRRQGWQAEYSAADDAFVFFVNQDFETGQSDESEAFAAFERDGQKFYPVGSGSWIWEESEAVAV